MQNREKVKADLNEYLSSKVGLDLKSVDVDITKLTFEGNKANATVSFHQKADTSVGAGMVMQYTLDQQNGHWVVTSRADSQGHGMGAGSANDSLPPGHPSTGALPPGHPNLSGGRSPGSQDSSQ